MKVWRNVKISTVPNGRRCVKYRWVLDIKQDGAFRARLLVCDYNQAPGEDFTEVYSTVTNDVVILILLIYMIVNKLNGRLLDVVTAFLHGTLQAFLWNTHQDQYVKAMKFLNC
jgi:Reverse transcriptase (RNA-dependent DNA polymerase)